MEKSIYLQSLYQKLITSNQLYHGITTVLDIKVAKNSWKVNNLRGKTVNILVLTNFTAEDIDWFFWESEAWKILQSNLSPNYKIILDTQLQH